MNFINSHTWNEWFSRNLPLDRTRMESQILGWSGYNPMLSSSKDVDKLLGALSLPHDIAMSGLLY